MDLILLTAVVTVLAGITTYLIARRDVRPGRAVAFAAGAALVVGVGFVFTVYLAVAAYVGAVVVWLLARRLLPNSGVALLVGAGVLVVGLAGSVLVMGYALDSMN